MKKLMLDCGNIEKQIHDILLEEGFVSIIPKKSKIDWPFQPLYTLNPIIGCKRGCYNGNCWAKRLNDRFHFVEDFSKLNIVGGVPQKIPGKGKYIFVGSMSDICYWDDTYLQEMIYLCSTFTEHTFLFLTKDPVVYLLNKFPKNSMIGLTIDCTECEDLQQLKCNMLLTGSKDTLGCFLSIEPMLGYFFAGKESIEIDKIIVGAMAGFNCDFDKKWIGYLLFTVEQKKIYWKNNIKKYL